MKNNAIKINENTLRKIVAESVKKVLKEGYDPIFDTYKNQRKIVSTLRNVQRELRTINRFGTSIPEPDLQEKVRSAQIAIGQALDLVDNETPTWGV